MSLEHVAAHDRQSSRNLLGRTRRWPPLNSRTSQKRFENGTEAVTDASLSIADGEFVVLVGPSGCGKSTLLRMIAGLDSVTSGEVRIDGHLVNDLPPKDRDIAMVFQGYALYPHMTVAENIAFSLNLRHRSVLM